MNLTEILGYTAKEWSKRKNVSGNRKSFLYFKKVNRIPEKQQRNKGD